MRRSSHSLPATPRCISPDDDPRSIHLVATDDENEVDHAATQLSAYFERTSTTRPSKVTENPTPSGSASTPVSFFLSETNGLRAQSALIDSVIPNLRDLSVSCCHPGIKPGLLYRGARVFSQDIVQIHHVLVDLLQIELIIDLRDDNLASIPSEELSRLRVSSLYELNWVTKNRPLYKEESSREDAHNNEVAARLSPARLGTTTCAVSPAGAGGGHRSASATGWQKLSAAVRNAANKYVNQHATRPLSSSRDTSSLSASSSRASSARPPLRRDNIRKIDGCSSGGLRGSGLLQNLETPMVDASNNPRVIINTLRIEMFREARPDVSEEIVQDLIRSQDAGALWSIFTGRSLYTSRKSVSSRKRKRQLAVINVLDTPAVRARVLQTVSGSMYLPLVVIARAADKLTGNTSYAPFFFCKFIVSQKTIVDSYYEMLETCGENFATALKLIALARGPVLMHCTLGKDRTGLLAMLILSVLGVPEQSIIFDYALTSHANAAYQLYNHNFITAFSGLPEEFCSSEMQTMILTLQHIKDRYGSMKQYLDSIGFTEPWRTHMRERYLLKQDDNDHNNSLAFSRDM